MNTFNIILLVGFGLLVLAALSKQGRSLIQQGYNRLLSQFKRVRETITDPVANAEIGLDTAEDKLDDFENRIANLLTKVKQDENRVPGLKAEVKKWEGIYQKAVGAGNVEHQEKASAELKRADERLAAATKAVNDNSDIVTQLREQARSYRDKLENGLILKDRLAAQRESATLRQDALRSSSEANSGLAALNELQTAVEREEARADALEELSGKDSDLEKVYSTASDEHLARLEKLKAGVAS